MRRIAANYYIPHDGAPIRNGYVELDGQGKIMVSGVLDKEMESTEFYSGIITPDPSGIGIVLIDKVDFTTLSPTSKSTYKRII